MKEKQEHKDKPDTAMGGHTVHHASSVFAAQLAPPVPTQGGASAVAPPSAPRICPDKADLTHEKSFGEKKFNAITYTGGMFWANLIFSAGLSYFAQNHTVGRKAYEGLRSGYRKLGLTNETAIKNLTNAFTLMMGGHLLAAFWMKPMEDRKLELVKKWDEDHYGPHAEAIPEVAQAHHALELEPKTTYLGVLAARMLSWTAVQGAAYTLGAEDNILRKWGNAKNIAVLKKFQGVDKYSVMGAEKLVKSLPNPLVNTGNFLLRPLASAEHQMGFMRYMKEMFSDIMYTVITAVSIDPINKHVVQKIGFFRENCTKNPLPLPPVLPSTNPADTTPPQTTAPALQEQPSSTIDLATLHAQRHFTPSHESAYFV